MGPMNLKSIISRGYVLHVRQDSRTFQNEKYYKFHYCNNEIYNWTYKIEKLMGSENYRFFHSFTNENETNKCFEIMYETNHNLLEKMLDDVGAKLVTVTRHYIRTVGGFKYRMAKMPYPRGILFDTVHHKMLYLLKHPNLFNEK
jgi:hypothetical protein